MSTRGVIHQVSLSSGGVPKVAVPRAEVDALGLVGDGHRDPGHGGPEQALCLYSWERIRELQAEGHPIAAGSIGENVTISGLDWDRVVPGAKIRLGQDVEIEVTSYTSPCVTISGAFRGGDFSRVLERQHPGWSRVYARVLRGGELTAGDAVALVS